MHLQVRREDRIKLGVEKGRIELICINANLTREIRVKYDYISCLVAESDARSRNSRRYRDRHKEEVPHR